MTVDTGSSTDSIRQALSVSKLSHRIKTPTQVQMEAAECAATALSIILSYHGRYVPVEELRYQCGVSRDGSDAYNLIEAARHYGLEADGYQLALHELPELASPFILFWERNHFIVLEGCTKEWVYINDPATGPRRITYGDFYKGYCNVAIELKPTSSFKKGGSPPKFWTMLLERLEFVKAPALFCLVLLQLATILLGLMPPALARVFMDNIVAQGLLSWKWPFYLLSTLSIILVAATTVVRGGVVNRLGTKLSICLSVQFLWHVIRLPLLFFSQRFGSEIINRMSLNTAVSNVITNQLAITVINAILVVLYGWVMIRYDVVIASLAFMTALGSIALLIAIARARANNYYRLQQDNTKTVGLSIDAIQHIESIKALGAESFFFNRIMGYSTKNVNNQQNIGEKDVWLTNSTEWFHTIASTALILVGGWRIMHGDLSVGMLLALQILMGNFLGPVQQLIAFGMQLQTLKIDMLRLDDVLKNRTVAQLDEPDVDVAVFKRKTAVSLELKNVTFGYSPLDEPLFKNINLKVKAGQRVALLGATGSGKSTLSKIVCGLYQPWNGTVLLDDKPLAEWHQGLLRKTLAWVDQEVILFSGTIKDNISLWDPNVAHDDLVNAAKDACIHDHIISRQLGYESVLTEGGTNVSEGQKQRLELARAFLTNPEILVLDEAMSAIDAVNESTILKNIDKRGCTCLIVTHRLSTAKTCDRIVVLEKGVIVQDGSHHELVDVPGVYKTLTQHQGDSDDAS